MPKQRSIPISVFENPQVNSIRDQDNKRVILVQPVQLRICKQTQRKIRIIKKWYLGDLRSNQMLNQRSNQIQYT